MCVAFVDLSTNIIILRTEALLLMVACAGMARALVVRSGLCACVCVFCVLYLREFN